MLYKGKARFKKLTCACVFWKYFNSVTGLVAEVSPPALEIYRFLRKSYYKAQAISL